MPNNIDEAKKNGWEKILPATPTSETQEKTGIGSALTEMKALNMISFLPNVSLECFTKHFRKRVAGAYG